MPGHPVALCANSSRFRAANRFRRSLVAALVLALGATLGFPDPPSAVGDDSGSWIKTFRLQYSRDSTAMSRLVAPLVKSVTESIVRIRVDDRVVALGTIVSEDGYVLTKRSELSGDPIRVQMSDGRSLGARVASVRRSNDLALLKIESTDRFKPVTFAVDPPGIASFLITPLSGRPSHVGIGTVSVNNRSLGHTGRLGVQLRRTQDRGAKVAWIYPDSGADRAGLLRGDQIVAINGQGQADRDVVMRTLGAMFPGEVVGLTIVREGNQLDVDARIREMALVQETASDSEINGPRNARLTGFDQVIQHDTVLAPSDCGGPVMDTSGRIVGINIARAGRVVSYALPAPLVTEQLQAMLLESRSIESSADAAATVP